MARFRFVGALALLVVAALLPVRAEPKKVLRYAFEVAETGFDPVQISDLYSRIIASEIFEAPLHYAYLGPVGKIVPLTAAAMPEVSPDFKTFTFRIRPGLFFADDPAFKGKRRELVAADYVYSLKRNFDPRWKSIGISELRTYDIAGLNALRDEALRGAPFDYDREVPGLRTLDRYTFRITLGVASPRFLNTMADSTTSGAVAREVVEAYGDKIMEHPVGTGPYRIVEWRRSSLIALEKNPSFREEYYDVEPDPSDAWAVDVARKLKGRRLPMVDRVEISIIEESQPRWLSFLNGEHDVLETLPEDLAPIAIPNNRPSPTLAKKKVVVWRAPRIDVYLVVYNMEHPVIGGYAPEKVALRRAINLAIDTDDVIRSRYKYQAITAQSVIMPTLFPYDPALRTEIGETDLARANALLDAYGYADRDGDGWREMPDGSPLELVLSTQPDQRSRIIDEIWRKAMGALHVRMRFRVAKWPEQLRMTRNGQYMIWYLGNSASNPDVSDALRYWYGPAIGAENLSRFRLAEFDAGYDRQKQLVDGPERKAEILDLVRLLTAYAPGNTLVHRIVVDMAYPWVVGYRRWPFCRDWWKYVDVDMDARSRLEGA